MGTIATLCRFGGDVGWGHLTRCSALMNVAKARGWKTGLWTTSDCGKAGSDRLASFDTLLSLEAYTFEKISQSNPKADVLLIDEMHLPDDFFGEARQLADTIGAKVVAMDDLGTRSLQSVDLAVNTEIGLRKANYAARSLALGESFCLLRPGFKQAKRRNWPLDPEAIPVLIMIGGADRSLAGLRALEALKRFPGSKRFAPIYVSGDGSGLGQIELELADFVEHRLEVGIGDCALADWIATARFGITGCGSSVFEFAALKTPFVGIVVADNQVRTSQSASRLWSMPIANGRDPTKTALAALIGLAVKELVDRLDDGQPFAFGGVDAMGAERLMDRIETLSTG